jgi:carbamoyltransferase
MLILGLNAYHGDASACLLRDGQLLAAAEEERFRRVKHWAGLPSEAIRYCLSEGGVELSEVDHVAINRKPGANNWRRLCFLLRHRPDLGLVRNRIRNIRAALSLEETLFRAFGARSSRTRVHYIEHHLAHLASAYCITGLPEAVCISVDGFGDFASTAWGIGRNGSIRIDGRIHFPHSLGIFYSAITQHLGFPHFGDEYKVMGLAAYGEPRYLRKMGRIVHVQSDGTFQLGLKYFRHHQNDLGYHWNGCAPSVGILFTPELERVLGPARRSGDSIEPRHYDLAHSAQAMYEEALFALLNALYRKYKCPNLALAGGCAMNSVANGKIASRSPFKRVFVPPAPGDAGGAIGAALVMWHRLQSRGTGSDATIRNPQSVLSHAFTGPQFEDAEIRDLLVKRGLLAEH